MRSITVASWVSLVAVAVGAVGWAASGPLGCGSDSSTPTAAAAPDPPGPDDDPANDGPPGGEGMPPPIPPDGGVQTPIPTKIRYVIVLVKENHTFDNYFTGFPGAETSDKAKLSTTTTITRPIAPNGPLASDLCHSNACGQTAYQNGAMAGFDNNNGGSREPFIRYTEQQIPNYWQYARCREPGWHGAIPSSSGHRDRPNRRTPLQCAVQRASLPAARLRVRRVPSESAMSCSLRPTSSSRAKRPRSFSSPRQCSTLAMAPIVTLEPPLSRARSVGRDMPARSATSAAESPRRFRASRTFSPTSASSLAT